MLWFLAENNVCLQHTRTFFSVHVHFSRKPLPKNTNHLGVHGLIYQILFEFQFSAAKAYKGSNVCEWSWSVCGNPVYCQVQNDYSMFVYITYIQGRLMANSYPHHLAQLKRHKCWPHSALTMAAGSLGLQSLLTQPVKCYKKMVWRFFYKPMVLPLVRCPTDHKKTVV